MRFVCILKSITSAFIQVGSTNDLDRLSKEHNDLKSLSTKAFAPFEPVAYLAVRSEVKARELEKF